MSEEFRTGSISPAVFIAASCIGAIIAVLLWAAGASAVSIILGYFGAPALFIAYSLAFARGAALLGRIAGPRRAATSPADGTDPLGVAASAKGYPSAPVSGTGDS